jgi:hypothetical protein
MTWIFLVIGLTIAASAGFLLHELYRFITGRFFVG